MKITEFDIEINNENVLKLIDCYKDNDLYEEVLAELKDTLPEAYDKICPVALLKPGSLNGISEKYSDTEVLFALVSVGVEMSTWSTELFFEGDYLKAMMVDAIADDYLFQMDHAVSKAAVEICSGMNKGISTRLEAPQDLPMKVQRRALEVTEGERLAGIKIKDSYMFDPVKTTCQVYVLDNDTDNYRIEHNCSTCPNNRCKLRNVSEYVLTLIKGDEKETIKAKDNQTVLETLIENKIFLNAVCSGRGTCGKCRIRLLEGSIPITEKDRSFFDNKKLDDGYRLACIDYLSSDSIIDIGDSIEKDFHIIADYSQNSVTGVSDDDDEYAISCDIGTTTIAAQLFSLSTGKIINSFATINKQRMYGADVISRIDGSNSGKKDLLQDSICTDLCQCIDEVTKNGKYNVKKMSIAGNTTMIHLLMGYSCETLGVSPFTPVNIEPIDITFNDLTGNDHHHFPVAIFPGISTYVGGDIVSGLFSLGFTENEKLSVLIDLGTNGEMAVGNKDKILVCSTAAGPAFEGGNITHGTGSIPGAISSVIIDNGDVFFKTIGDREPTGICGTGVVDTTAELVKEELIDETGLLDDEFADDGFLLGKSANGDDIVFTQKDVREIQLAKSAVRAGFETLLLRYGAKYDDIDSVYIAGGFGYKIDIKKAIGIGLLPEEIGSKTQAVGNTSLKGTYDYLIDDQAAQKISHIREVAEEISLSSDKDFSELYMKHMYFE